MATDRLVPFRLRGGAESPWNSDGGLISTYSDSESIQEVPSSEPLRIEQSKNESAGEAALPGEAAPVPPPPPAPRDETPRGEAPKGPSPLAPAREGLYGTARMLGCRVVEAPAVLAGVLGVVGLRPSSSPICPRSPASESDSCHGAADVGTGGTGLFLSGGLEGAGWPEVSRGRCHALVRRFLSSTKGTSSPTFLICRWCRSLYSMMAVTISTTEKPTTRPAIRPAWLNFGGVETYGTGDEEDEVEYGGERGVEVVSAAAAAVVSVGVTVSEMTTAVVVSEDERDWDVDCGTAELMMEEIIGSGADENPGWSLIGQPPSSSQGSMEQQPLKLLTAQV
ncbi:hypothetical protein VM1G_11388 [Cytospora mali]|uniref:Uncharacterized protein n=1 Tax=Cytospora mali TaxID=578113 RepID=A0A194VRA1_CYTMA|nr:hypothetical protein VM1G_11388 [Valsa mali]